MLDLTHQIDPGDVEAAAFALEAAYAFYPEGTVFCCVVDPGVGTRRAGICATDGRFFFVAPDNGLLGRVARAAGRSFRVYRLENEAFFLDEISATYHGRDVFAPSAAHIARGVAPERFGPAHEPLLPPTQTAVFEHGELQGRIIYVDVYGNLFTNIPSAAVAEQFPGDPDRLKLRLAIPAGEREIAGMVRTFGEVKAGGPLFYAGSSGYVEIAVNRGRACDYFEVGTGAAVKIGADPAETD